MDESHRTNRISRLVLENIAPINYYKPVSERNKIFSEIRRNSSILSNPNPQVAEQKLAQGQNISDKSKRYQKAKNQIKRSNNTEKHRSFSLSESRKQNRSLLISQTLPEIHQSKQFEITNLRKNVILKKRKSTQKNEIEGSKVGIFSTHQILQKYANKKIKQQLQKKQFLEDYIKNMKIQDIQTDQISQITKQGLKLTQRISFTRPLIPVMNKISQTQSTDLTQSQLKLVELLQNRFTDRDFIDFNVKLFEKRDINKKKYFQRYHNILKKQRDQIS